MSLQLSPGLKQSLSDFLDAFARIGVEQAPSKSVTPSSLEVGFISDFLKSMEAPLKAARASAWDFDPWEIAGLGRDEVRNARVLAWLMNPMGSHGYGDALLQNFLDHLRVRHQDFPASLGRYCRVRTEQSPNGERSERVDIEVDAASFYLLVEVKIGAPEGDEQLRRYAQLARTMAGQRPWKIIYLTPKKQEAKTAGDYSDHIVAMSWREISRMIEGLASATPKSSASSWHAANHAVISFAKHIRNH